MKYIVDAVNLLHTNLPSTLSEFRNLGLVKDRLYKKAEYTIQNILDICSIINMDLGLGIPETEDSIFDDLTHRKIFDKGVVNLIREMRGGLEMSSSTAMAKLTTYAHLQLFKRW